MLPGIEKTGQKRAKKVGNIICKICKIMEAQII